MGLVDEVYGGVPDKKKSIVDEVYGITPKKKASIVDEVYGADPMSAGSIVDARTVLNAAKKAGSAFGWVAEQLSRPNYAVARGASAALPMPLSP